MTEKQTKFEKKTPDAEIVVTDKRHTAMKPVVQGESTDDAIIIALKSGQDPALIERFMDLAERKERMIKEQLFMEDFGIAQENMPIVPKRGKNTQTNSNYALYEDLIKHIKPIYTAQGLSILMYPGALDQMKDLPPVPEGEIRVFADVMHKAGYKRTFFIDMPLDDKGIKGTVNKTKPHARGSSFSYAKSNLMKMIWNIPTGDDDDGQAAGAKVDEFITKDQAKKITKRLKAIYGDDPSMFMTWLKSAVKAETIDTILAKKHDEVIRAIANLEKKAKEAKKERQPGDE